LKISKRDNLTIALSSSSIAQDFINW